MAPLIIISKNRLSRETWAVYLQERAQIVASIVTDSFDDVCKQEQFSRAIIVIELLDWSSDWLDKVREIQRLSCGARIIVICSGYAKPYICKLKKIGIWGWLVSDSKLEELLSVVVQVLAGKKISLRIVRSDSGEAISLPQAVLLSGRQEEIAEFLAVGMTRNEIADRLGICLKTVETHQYQIVRKLKIKRMRQMANTYMPV